MMRSGGVLRKRVFAGGAGFALVAAAIAVGQDTPIPMKLGLWDAQVTSTTAMKLPAATEARIAAMPAAQQAQMRAAMGGKPLVNDYKSCVATQTSLDDFLNQVQERPGAKCTFTNRVKTATGASFDTSCTSPEGTAAGHTDVLLTDDQHLSATTHMTANANGPNGAMQMSVDSTITWKYLGADCGTVKPNSTSD